MMSLGCVFVFDRAYALVCHRAYALVVGRALLHGDYQTGTDVLWLELFLCANC